MRIFVTLALLLTMLAGPATAFDRKPRKKRNPKKEQTTQQTAAPQQTTAPRPAAPAPEPEDSLASKRTPRTWCDTTVARDLTPRQVDSLAAVWQEQRRLEAFNRFFDEFVANVPASEDPTPDSLYVCLLYTSPSPRDA